MCLRCTNFLLFTKNKLGFLKRNFFKKGKSLKLGILRNILKIMEVW